MDLEIRVFGWPNQAHHVVMMARGAIDSEAFKQMFRKIEEIGGPLLDCKILIDLLDARCGLETGEIDQFLSRAGSDRLPHHSKIALVCARVNNQYERFDAIGANLKRQGVKVAVFDDSNAAAGWLAGIV